MKNIDIGDSEKYLDSPNIFHTPLHNLSSPGMGAIDLCPLSPILFEESSLEQLWNDKSSAVIKPLPSLLKPESVSIARNKNGLKGLSWKVKEVVESLGAAKYKEVANSLLCKMQIPQTNSPLKDEKNIRRRVYDALNVLVAAKVIRKQGKKVMPMSSELLDKGGNREKNDFLNEKREKLKSLVRSYIGLKNLFERNSMQSKSSQTVPYPLAVVAMPKTSKFEVSMIRGENAVIDVFGKYQVINKDHVLKNMGLLFKNADIPQELKSLCGGF